MQRLALHILGLLLVTVSACSGIAAEPITPVLLTTFTNPTPATDDRFGGPVAPMGTDRVLIGVIGDDLGATDSGVAHLLRTDGVLLTTFTNPTPSNGDNFGYSVAAIGSDRVLVGAPQDDSGASNAGTAYLFSTNGTLLTTFTNPTPATSDAFGGSVAAVGSDRVLIGASGDDTGAVNAGAAYLFSTNGALLTTYLKPIPAARESLGSSVVAVGLDSVLVGAPNADAGAINAGEAYLFATNGVVLTLFTNPMPIANDYFGLTVAAVGTNRVLIGAPGSPIGPSVGKAYLYSTSGQLLTIFTDPKPSFRGHFGWSVAAVGGDKLLIGARSDDTGASGAGAAYLFNTNGTLLTTFTNPTPASFDNLGISVAAVGTDRVLLGAFEDDQGAPNAGVAYLFLLIVDYLPLTIAHSNNQYSVTWVTDEPGLILQQSDVPGLAALWMDTPELVVTNGLTNLVQQTVPVGVTNRFYRLRRP